jgi:dTDP-glucose 4,6-dehydratase
VVKEDVGNILTKCRGEIDSLRGSTLLITGSTGFLAREFTETLLEAIRSGSSIKLVLTSRDVNKVRSIFGERVNRNVDIVPIDEIDSYTGKIDYIVHAAAPCDPRLNNESPFKAMVDIGNLMQKAIAVGMKNDLRNFLLLSSGAVYGVQPPDMKRISEEYNGAPALNRKDSGYGEAKRVSELMLTTSGLPYTILRGFSFIGPNQDLNASFAAPEFISSALREKRIVIRGDGRPIRSYCYESDLAVMLFKSLIQAGGQTLNAGNDRPEISIWELAEIVSRKISGITIRVDGERTMGLPPRYVPNIDRMRMIYYPTVNVESGIGRVIRHVTETTSSSG